MLYVHLCIVNAHVLYVHTSIVCAHVACEYMLHGHVFFKCMCVPVGNYKGVACVHMHAVIICTSATNSIYPIEQIIE